jgi:xanthine dehydrogenase molybdenum-binding subunit
VLRIYTPEDDPGKALQQRPFLPDQPELRDERIFTDRPFHVGDAIGAVLAETEEAARGAVALVKVAYDVREPSSIPSSRWRLPRCGTLFPMSSKNHRLWRRRALEGGTRSPWRRRAHASHSPRRAMENHLCHAYREYGRRAGGGIPLARWSSASASSWRISSAFL